MPEFDFLSYPVPATGAPTRRTLPTRLGINVKNVKDFGATGNGVTDDLATIQAAVDALWGVTPTLHPKKGTVFFPPGTYYVSGPIETAHGSTAEEIDIVLCGVGTASKIVGNFDGGVISRWYPSFGSGVAAMPMLIENLWIDQQGTTEQSDVATVPGSHCIFLQSPSCAMIRNVRCTTAKHGIGIENNQGFSVFNCHIICSGSSRNRWGIHVTGNGTVTSCYIKGFSVGARISQIGGSTTNCYITGNDIGFEGGPFGIDPYTGGAFSGVRTLTNVTETGSVVTNGSGIDAAGNFTAASSTGTNKAGDSFGISGTSTFAYYADDITTTPVATFCKTVAINQFLTPCVILSNCFDSNIVGMSFNSPGSGAGPSLIAGNSITGAASSSYGIRSGASPERSVFMGNTVSGTFSVAAITTPSRISYDGQVHIGTSAFNSGAGVDWGEATPNNLITNRYINSNSTGPVTRHVFGGLPDGTNQNRYVGATFWITDGNGTGAWGSTVTGGSGANHVKVRWNGSAWTVVGK